MSRWIYYSSRSGNTERLMMSAGLQGLRIPRSMHDFMPSVEDPFILVIPSFSDANGANAVPKQVIRFLNDPEHRHWLRGVVGCGDRNFGEMFALAGQIVSEKCKVPLLHRVEMFGTQLDWDRLQQLDCNLNKQQPSF